MVRWVKIGKVISKVLSVKSGLKEKMSFIDTKLLLDLGQSKLTVTLLCDKFAVFC